jgi:hypothetical protein
MLNAHHFLHERTVRVIGYGWTTPAAMEDCRSSSDHLPITRREY